MEGPQSLLRRKIKALKDAIASILNDQDAGIALAMSKTQAGINDGEQKIVPEADHYRKATATCFSPPRDGATASGRVVSGVGRFKARVGGGRLFDLSLTSYPAGSKASNPSRRQLRVYTTFPTFRRRFNNSVVKGWAVDSHTSVGCCGCKRTSGLSIL